MSWHQWAEELRNHPQQAVADLLRGATNLSPFERYPHEFLLAVMPVDARLSRRHLMGEPATKASASSSDANLLTYLDSGLSAWLARQQQLPLPHARKLTAYATQVSEALQWPVFFDLPETRSLLKTGRAEWLKWFSSLTLSAYLDPEYDYWQALATNQTDDELQFFWQSFISEARRTRSWRYLNLGLMALSKLPIGDNDSLRNLRLQIQALINRYQQRKGLGIYSQKELANNLARVIARNPSMSEGNYRQFLSELLLPLGEDTVLSVLSLMGLKSDKPKQVFGKRQSETFYRIDAPGNAEDTSRTVENIQRSHSLLKAWDILCREINSQEEYLHKSGDAYYFVRVLDRCVRALCVKYRLDDPEILPRLFQWIQLSLRLEPEEPRRWMLWELVLRKANQLQRAKWVLWEMTRRFPDNLPCRVDLARMLIKSDIAGEKDRAKGLLCQVLELGPDNLHAMATLATLALRDKDWPLALEYAQKGLQIDGSDRVCALLLASAYDQRHEPDDRQTAIQFLTRFNNRYPDQQVERFLKKLLSQKASVSKEKRIEAGKGNTADNVVPSIPETETAWLTFSNTLPGSTAQPSKHLSNDIEDLSFADRTLALPEALQLAATQRKWDPDLLARYETSDREEFPLETRLWSYLLIRHSPSAHTADKEKAREAVQLRIDFEVKSESDDSSYKRYLYKEWANVNADTPDALDAGAAWLEVLTDRYRPLPAPLYA